MHTGAITGYIDVAQLVLYAFWIFFAALIFYLHRENKREGYPLESRRANARVKVQGWPAMPAPKTFKLAHGRGEIQVPRPSDPQIPIAAVASGPASGAPLIPTGDPMRDAVGPAAYALRADVPDLAYDGTPKLAPLRVATDHMVEEHDPDPRGKPVWGLDGAVGGIVRDLWVDRSEALIRYLEVETATDAGPRRTLLPLNLARIGADGVRVKAVKGAHFAHAPGLRNPEVVTRLEEDRICAYFASGHLYATEARLEPLI
jgi:photosynthetic reaction center H subunit